MAATLYHAPLACSLAVRIAAAEGGVPLELAITDLGSKAVDGGGSLLTLNPLGQVSTMVLDSGEMLTETATCLLWVQAQSTAFAVTPKDPAYFQMVRWLGFCATELHKQIFRIVFYDEATDTVKDRIRDLAPDRFAVLEAQLSDRPFLTGNRYTAADAYLTWFFVLAAKAGVDPQGYSHLGAYRDRVLARPAVSATIADDLSRKAG